MDYYTPCVEGRPLRNTEGTLYCPLEPYLDDWDCEACIRKYTKEYMEEIDRRIRAAQDKERNGTRWP